MTGTDRILLKAICNNLNPGDVVVAVGAGYVVTLKSKSQHAYRFEYEVNGRAGEIELLNTYTLEDIFLSITNGD